MGLGDRRDLGYCSTRSLIWSGLIQLVKQIRWWADTPMIGESGLNDSLTHQSQKPTARCKQHCSACGDLLLRTMPPECYHYCVFGTWPMHRFYGYGVHLRALVHQIAESLAQEFPRKVPVRRRGPARHGPCPGGDWPVHQDMAAWAIVGKVVIWIFQRLQTGHGLYPRIRSKCPTRTPRSIRTWTDLCAESMAPRALYAATPTEPPPPDLFFPRLH